jgi:hypothetical protein
VTFKDDHSSYRFIFLMKHKNEVFTHIQHLYCLVLNHIGRRIIRFWSDNGKEYVDRKVEDYFAKKGICQEFTVTYTPEQNVVAE